MCQVAVQGIGDGKPPPPYECTYDAALDCWHKTTEEDATTLPEGRLDLPCDAQFVNGEWVHEVIVHGMVCASCYGEHDHWEGPKGGPKQHVILEKEAVPKLWSEELKRTVAKQLA